MDKAPFCDYCGQPAVLVTGAAIYRGRPDLADLFFWQCAPCDAYVGCHREGSGPPDGKRSDGTMPLGRLADAQLRMWKSNLHIVFDGHWKRQAAGMSKNQARLLRNAAYARLAAALTIPVDQCHIGMFDIPRCKAAIAICRAWSRPENKELV